VGALGSRMLFSESTTRGGGHSQPTSPDEMKMDGLLAYLRTYYGFHKERKRLGIQKKTAAPSCAVVVELRLTAWSCFSRPAEAVTHSK